MLTLPVKFAAENAKCPNVPAYIVKIQDEAEFSEQTNSADWAAAVASSNMDWTTVLGDVNLAQAPEGDLPHISQLNIDANETLHFSEGIWDEWFQSIKQTTGYSRRLDHVSVRVSAAPGGGYAEPIYCQVYASDKTTPIGSPVEMLVPQDNAYAVRDFIFSSQNIFLSHNTTHWLRIYQPNADGDGPFISISEDPLDYTNGQLDRYWRSLGDGQWYWDLNKGALYMVLGFTGIHGSYFETTGYLTTKTFDLGLFPTIPGEFQTDDTVPSGAALSYEGWSSSTGAFAGEETTIGALIDGQALAAGARYYRIKATFTPNAARDQSPVLRALVLDFSHYRSYSDKHQFGYEPSVIRVSGLETQIDAFNPSTISQITLTLAHTASVSEFIAERYPKNKVVKILAGFVAAGFAEADFIDYAWGQIDDWYIDGNDNAVLIIKDFSKEWDVDVPASWEDTGDDVQYIAMHPVDVCLDLLLNHVQQRESKLDRASLDTVKAARPGWVVTRTITKNPISAKDLLAELRVLLGAYFIPQANGGIKMKLYNPAEAATDTITDDNAKIKAPHKGNAKALLNWFYVYYGWDGDGDDADSFTGLLIDPDNDSRNAWKEKSTKTIKDKWTIDDAQGLTQLSAMTGALKARYASPPPILQVDVYRSRITIECGDMVSVTTRRAPSADGTGIQNQKYQVVKRGLDFTKDTISLTLLRA
jgi:hypothetical protein